VGTRKNLLVRRVSAGDARRMRGINDLLGVSRRQRSAAHDQGKSDANHFDYSLSCNFHDFCLLVT
jgi:hypothetical protein